MSNLYNLIFENLPNAVIVSDKNRKYIDINEAFSNLIGYSREEILGNDYTFFTHPDDLKASADIVSDAINSNQAFFIQEKRYITKSEKVLSVKLKIRIVRDPLDGKPEFYITEVFDIEEEKKRESIIQNKEATFQATFKAIPDLMFLTDAFGVYMDFKAEQKSELYLPPEMFLGKNIRNVLPPELADAFLHYMAIAYKSNELQVFEYELLINGEMNNYEARMVVTDNQNILTIVRNISERKNAEKTIIQAKESAEIANRAKSDFLSMMSHEIRTPLNGVVGAASLLLQTELNQEQKELIDVLVASAGTLLQVVDDILDFSKIESGRVVLDPEPFVLYQFLKEILALFIPKVINKDLTINFKIQDEVPPIIFCDKFRLKQILINLVSNAIKFTEHGFIKIEVHCVSRKDESVLLEISVRDSGIGIPLEKKESIFSPFMQADVSTSKRFGGTGLGLSICSKLCGAMGGSIRLESKLGEGSNFIFTIKSLEFKETSLFPIQKEIVNDEIKIDEISQIRQIKILIVDDNSMNREILKRMLGKIGYDCDIACGGYEAVNGAKSTDYDLILMDIQMPEMDGFEATTQILELKKQTKVFALTASATEQNRNKSKQIGFHEFLSKPVRIPILKEAILKWFP